MPSDAPDTSRLSSHRSSKADTASGSYLLSRRAAVGLVGVGLAVYFASLVVMLPARTLAGWAGLPADTMTLSGTAWQGTAVTQAGYALTWETSLLRSLSRLAFAVDWTASGAQTDLAGRAEVGRGDLILENVTGRADVGLFAAAGLPVPDCDQVMRVAVERLFLMQDASVVVGMLEAPAGQCRINGQVRALPPLVIDMAFGGAGSLGSLFEAGREDTPLARLELSEDGLLSIDVTEEGSRVLPGLEGRQVGVEIDLRASR